jgi:hypothetical protein
MPARASNYWLLATSLLVLGYLSLAFGYHIAGASLLVFGDQQELPVYAVSGNGWIVTFRQVE